MDTNRKIVQSLLLKDYASLKESVFSLLYAKASVALDEARVAVANAVFNEATELDEGVVGKIMKKAKRFGQTVSAKLGTTGRNKDIFDRIDASMTPAEKLKDKEWIRSYHWHRKQAQKKPVKEATEQLDEVSPPDMEKMTGSKKTKASFTKQYGKRGKSVMYATAWKLHNKKAGKD